MDSRGLVIAPRYEARADGALYFPGSVHIEANALRFYLLYWDRLDYPLSNVFHVVSPPDITFLEKENVLKRTQVTAPTAAAGFGAAYAIGQFAVLRSRNNDEPGLWSLAQTGTGFLLPKSESEESRSLEIELYQALPVPSEKVSLADVLDFKAKRNGELLALRNAMDGLYQETIGAADLPRAKTTAMNVIEKTVSDLHKVTREAWPSRMLSSLKMEYTLPNVVGGAVLLASQFGLEGAILGALGSCLKFEPKGERIKSLPTELKDFAYVAHAERELR